MNQKITLIWDHYLTDYNNKKNLIYKIRFLRFSKVNNKPDQNHIEQIILHELMIKNTI